jgi:hypothetical protein
MADMAATRRIPDSSLGYQYIQRTTREVTTTEFLIGASTFQMRIFPAVRNDTDYGQTSYRDFFKTFKDIYSKHQNL